MVHVHTQTLMSLHLVRAGAYVLLSLALTPIFEVCDGDVGRVDLAISKLLA
jgi:hypothetical protein